MRRFAHRDSFPTNLRIEFVAGGDPAFISGDLRSPRQGCLPDRTVKLIAIFDEGEREVVDVDRSSRNGAWALKGSLSGAERAKVKVTKEDIGRSDHRHICQPDAVVPEA
jgi:hypothetical protein